MLIFSIYCLMMLCVEITCYAQKNETQDILHPIIEDCLLAQLLTNQTVEWYFSLSNYDTIYLVKNHFCDSISSMHVSKMTGKTIVFISGKENPPQKTENNHIVIEIIGLTWKKNEVNVSIGKHNEARVRLKYKKKRKKYYLKESGIS